MTLALLACAPARAQDVPPPPGAPGPELVEVPPPPPSYSSQPDEREDEAHEDEASEDEASEEEAPPRTDRHRDSFGDVYVLAWEGFGIGAAGGGVLGALIGGIALCDEGRCALGIGLGAALAGGAFATFGAAIAVGFSDRGGNSILALGMSLFPIVLGVGVGFVIGLENVDVPSGVAAGLAIQLALGPLSAALWYEAMIGLFELARAVKPRRTIALVPFVGVSDDRILVGAGGRF